MLPVIPSKDPAVIMGILGIYKIALEHQRLGIPKEVIATQIVPFLFPLSVEPGLSLQQFRVLMAMVRDMMHKVEEEQKAKLENVAALQEQQRSALHLTINPSTVVNNGPQKDQNTPSKALTGSVQLQVEPLFAQLSTGVDVTKQVTPAVQPLDSLLTLKAMNSSSIDSGLTAYQTTPGVLTPSTTWNRNVSKDAVSSMMQSNLTEMRMQPLVNNQWNSASMPIRMQTNSMSWSSTVQPQHTPMAPMAPTGASLFSPAQFPLSHLPSHSNAPVRTLARADIDDLLS